MTDTSLPTPSMPVMQPAQGSPLPVTQLADTVMGGVPFGALKRLSDQLLEAKLDDETVGFIIGKLFADLSQKAATTLVETVGEQRLAEIAQLPSPEQQLQQLDADFQSKKGISVVAMREQLAEDLVKEYEALA